mmetsp:Transcript_7386/g.27019  ORF Transcript_7386/g.27019 Transcript_7386/m.27019 type:complete len:162 (-) Transcript_7386:257-742(-)
MGGGDCWSWGVHQHLARTCAPQVTDFIRCCKTAGQDARDLWPPLPAAKAAEAAEAAGRPCQLECSAAQRCIVAALLEKEGEQACRKSFRTFLDGGGDDEKLLTRAWRCAFDGRNYVQPLVSLITQSQAVGECRPAVPVENTSGKGAWTAGYGRPLPRGDAS